MLTRKKLDDISRVICDNNVVLSDLFCAYINGCIESQELTGPAHTLQEELRSDSALNRIIRTLLTTRQTKESTMKIARNVTVRAYAQELGRLLLPSAGFHANVAHAVPSQFHAFSSMKLANKFEETCPNLWKLFGVLLNSASVEKTANEANRQGDYLTEITYRGGKDKPALRHSKTSHTVEAVADEFNDMPDEDWGMLLEEMGSSDEADWETGDGVGKEPKQGVSNQFEVPAGAPWRKTEGNALDRALERSHVRRIGLFSICMMNSNVRCNALQAVFGLFLHSTNTPEKVVELFSHLGLSVAPSSIDRMVNSMSKSAMDTLKHEFQDFVTALAFDNLEIRFDTEQPTVTHQGKLVSMTTGTCIPLRPGAKKNDLKVSDILWSQSAYNPNRTLPPVILSHDRLMEMLQQCRFSPSDERSVESLYAWHARNIILNEDVETISPALKEEFRRGELGLPTARSFIVHPKTTQHNLRLMNISASTNSGTGAALDNMLGQGGASNKDLETHVMMIHGDLGTGKHLFSLQESRSIEDTARDRMQFVVFVPGWFHTRMAMADSIWRLWIEPDKPSSSCPTHPHSIFQLCTLLRPREVGKISTNPGFRRTHSLIEHTALATITDAWRLIVKSKFGVELGEWKPTWAEVLTTSHELVKEHVAGIAYEPAKRPNRNKDMVYDQMRLFNRDALLYMATTRASRCGDVRRVEELLIQWIYLWRRTKKHQYAAEYTRFLTHLQGGWPDTLSKIVRENWLANPTGKPDGFRGVDWVVERNNYMHKCLHSGSGVNRTLEYLMKQSPLIQDYQAVHSIVETQMYLSGGTAWHPPPIMKTSLAVLRTHLEGEKMSSPQLGRVLSTPPSNAIAEGVAAALASPGNDWFVPEEDSAEGERDGVGGEIEDGMAEVQPRDLAVDE